MTPITLLVGLLVVAYVGSVLLGGRALRGYGLPSGCEWLLLGFVLGPLVLGVVSQQALSAFEPVAGVSMAWLALLSGLECGHVRERKLRPVGWGAAILGTLVVACVVGLAVFTLALRVLSWPVHDALIAGAALGLAGSETARHAVRWAALQNGGGGRLASLLERVADTDDLVPMLGLGWVFAWAAATPSVVSLGAVPWFGVTVGLGALLGLTGAMLLRTTRGTSDGFGVVLGAALLGTGIAWRLSLSPLTVMFVMGLTLAASARGSRSVFALVTSTEPTVTLPTLLLAGALVRPPLTMAVLLLALVTVLARGLVRALLGWLVMSSTAAPPRARAAFALGSSATGALTVIMGLSCAFRFRGPLGESILAVAACVTLVGEIVGPAALRRALQLQTPDNASPTPPGSAAGAGA